MTADQLTLQAFLAMVTPRIIQWLKAQRWFPFADFDAASMNRVFSWFIAAITAVGVAFHFDPSVGTLTITGLTMAGVLHAAGAALLQIAANDHVYKTVVAPAKPGVEQADAREATKVALPVSFVGDPINGSTHLFSVKRNDPTSVGEAVQCDPRGKFVKRSGSVYEKLDA